MEIIGRHLCGFLREVSLESQRVKLKRLRQESQKPCSRNNTDIYPLDHLFLALRNKVAKSCENPGISRTQNQMLQEENTLGKSPTSPLVPWDQKVSI